MFQHAPRVVEQQLPRVMTIMTAEVGPDWLRDFLRPKQAPSVLACPAKNAAEADADFWWSAMKPEDVAYARSQPKRRFAPLRHGGRDYDPWPPEETTMNFGKHKGRTLGEIAVIPGGIGYLKWLADSQAGDGELRADAAKVVSRAA